MSALPPEEASRAPERMRLWQALGLGPMWRERGPVAGAALPAGAPGADASAAAASPAAQLGSLGWDGLRQAVAACTACGLCRTRKQTVFSAGSQDARWLFVGEAPGAEEDARGEPFVGQAGKLLDNMLGAAGLTRAAGAAEQGSEAVYIANVIKCRPPGNRNPDAAEVAACAPFLHRQIELLRPRLAVVMGRFAVQALLGRDVSIASLRGRVHEARLPAGSLPIVVTYHPAYLLRTPADKAKSWEDLCLARATYERLAAEEAGAGAA